ncbi:hypothetical protein VTJ04DRAFT_9202 [Mycothermus thermophilus]|uniref:uncharacterized protein n=1 Tax=Humicola insolens TaxID=85995 RepID=UPI0037424758
MFDSVDDLEPDMLGHLTCRGVFRDCICTYCDDFSSCTRLACPTLIEAVMTFLGALISTCMIILGFWVHMDFWHGDATWAGMGT